MNQINALGRLTADPKLTFTATSKAVAKFTLAVKRSFTGQNGEKKTDFIPCIIWGNSAELIAKNLRKGHRIYIAGNLYTDEYEKDGQKHYTFYINIEKFEYVENKAKNAEAVTEIPESSTAEQEP